MEKPKSRIPCVLIALMLAAPALGGFLVERFSYSFNFAISAALVAVSFVILVTVVEQPVKFVEEVPRVSALVRVMKYFGIVRR